MMETTGSNMPNMSNAPDRAHGAVDRVAQTAHQAVDRIASKAAPAVERVRSTASSAADSMQSRMEDFGAMQEEWAESMRDQVRAHPLAVVGLAVLAGMLLGRLSR
jgi:ElaB/YqjD/DUF883 family membrane-anchored ribosome-binding protein